MAKRKHVEPSSEADDEDNKELKQEIEESSRVVGGWRKVSDSGGVEIYEAQDGTGGLRKRGQSAGRKEAKKMIDDWYGKE
jgi:hypothetical protein